MHTIFLDFGNVIGFFDHSRAIAQLLPYTHLNAAELDQAIYGSQAMTHYETGLISSDEFFAISVKAGHLSCNRDRFFEAYADIFTRNDEVCHLIPRLAEQYHLVLASNTSEGHYLRYCEDYADVLGYLREKVASHLVHARKPSPSFYAACQACTPAAPRECLFVDDLPKNIRGAEAHGFRGLLYVPGHGWAEQLQALGLRWSESGAASSQNPYSQKS